MHVQVTLTDVPSHLGGDYGSIDVTGTIAKLYRKSSSCTVEVGDRIQFSMEVVAQGCDVLDGGIGVTFDDVVQFKVVEVCLNRTGPNQRYTIPANLFDVLPSLTDQPSLNFDNASATPPVLPRSPEAPQRWRWLRVLWPW